MVSRRVLVAVAVLVTIGVLGVGAATLPTLDAMGSDNGGGENGETDAGDGDPTETLVINIPSWLVAGIFALGVVLAAVAGVLLLREGNTRFLRIMAIAIALGILLLLLIELVDIPVTFEEQPFNETGDERPGNGGNGNGENGDSGTAPTAPLSALLALLVAGLVGAAMFYWRAASQPDESETEEDETPHEAVKQAADRAVDRIEQDSLENGVYQAWYEMTAALSVEHPETRTPEEFKQAAIAEGFARKDVAKLTELFREVRYGNRPITEEREQEAMETLRRIATYRENADESQCDRDGG